MSPFSWTKQLFFCIPTVVALLTVHFQKDKQPCRVKQHGIPTPPAPSSPVRHMQNSHKSTMIWRLSMGCHIVSPAPVWVQIPVEAGYPGVGILNLYYSTGSWKLFWYPLCGIQCQREAVWVAAESGNLWSGALRTATTTTSTNTSAFNYISRHIGDTETEFNKFCCGCHLHST